MSTSGSSWPSFQTPLKSARESRAASPRSPSFTRPACMDGPWPASGNLGFRSVAVIPGKTSTTVPEVCQPMLYTEPAFLWDVGNFQCISFISAWYATGRGSACERPPVRILHPGLLTSCPGTHHLTSAVEFLTASGAELVPRDCAGRGLLEACPWLALNFAPHTSSLCGHGMKPREQGDILSPGSPFSDSSTLGVVLEAPRHSSVLGQPQWTPQYVIDEAAGCHGGAIPAVKRNSWTRSRALARGRSRTLTRSMVLALCLEASSHHVSHHSQSWGRDLMATW